jgi:hypothetical protein
LKSLLTQTFPPGLAPANIAKGFVSFEQIARTYLMHSAAGYQSDVQLPSYMLPQANPSGFWSYHQPFDFLAHQFSSHAA